MYKGRAEPLTGQQKDLADLLRAPAPKCIKFLSMISVSNLDPQLASTNLGFMLCLGIETMLTASAESPDGVRNRAEQLVDITNRAQNCLSKLDFHDRDIQAIKRAPNLMRTIATHFLEHAQASQQKMAATQFDLGLERQILTQATHEILGHVQQHLDKVRSELDFVSQGQDVTRLREAFDKVANLTTTIAPGIHTTVTTAREKLPPPTDSQTIIHGYAAIIGRRKALHAGILTVARKLDAAFSPRRPSARKEPANPATSP